MSNQINFVLNATIDKYMSNLEQAQRKMAGLVQAGEKLSSIGQNLTIGVTLPTAAIAGFGLKLASEMEQAQVAFTTMTGSAEQANKTLGELKEFAASTPFEFPELQDAAKKLIAFGVSTDDVTQSLRSIGDISAGIGAPIGEIAEIFGKAKVQGRLFAEDINQLTGRGIPIIQELAKQFGVTDGEVKKLVENGQVNFGNLEQAFTDLTKEGGKFGGLMEAQSQTLGGLWSTLTDNISMSLADMGADLATAFDLKGVMSSVSSAVQSVSAAFQNLSPEAKKVIFVVAGIAAAAGPLAIALGGFMTMLPALTAGFATLGTAITAMTGPVGIAIAAIALGAVLIIKNWDTIKAYFTSGGGAKIFDKIADVAGKAFAMLKAVINRFVKWGTWAWDTFGGAIIGYAKYAWDNITGVISGALDILGGIFDVFKNLWEGNWAALWDSVLNLGKLAVNGLIDLVAGVFTALPRLMNGILKGLGIENAFTKGLDKSLAAVKGFVDKVKFETKELPSLLAPGADTGTESPGINKKKGKGGEEELSESAKKQQEILQKLREEFNLAANQFAVFGASFDVLGSKSKSLESAIVSLLEQGIKPQSSLIQVLKAQLDGLNAASLEGLSNTFETFATSGITALDSINARLDAFKAKTVDVYAGVSVATTNFMAEQAAMAQASVEMVASMADMIHGAIAGSFTGIGEVIGNAMAGISMSAGTIASMILTPFADMAVQLGTYAISMGIGVEAIKASLASMSGVGAIAAGIALVALGTAAKGVLGKMSKGGGGAAPKIPTGGGVQSPRPSRSATQSGNNQNGPQTLRFELEGSTLVAATNQFNMRNRRIR